MSLGLGSVAKIRATSEEDLVGHFGKFGRFLWREARGVDERPVDPTRETKSIGRERTFETDSDDTEAVRATLLNCVRHVHQEMTDEGHWCHTLTVKIRYEGYDTHSRQTTMRLSSGSLPHLERGALTLVEPFLTGGRRVRLVGFAASKLVGPDDLLPLT